MIGGNILVWRGKKQSLVSHSSGEAEYRSITIAYLKLFWTKTLFLEMIIYLEMPMWLYCENKAKISIQHVRMRHTEILGKNCLIFLYQSMIPYIQFSARFFLLH